MSKSHKRATLCVTTCSTPMILFCKVAMVANNANVKCVARSPRHSPIHWPLLNHAQIKYATLLDSITYCSHRWADTIHALGVFFRPIHHQHSPMRQACKLLILLSLFLILLIIINPKAKLFPTCKMTCQICSRCMFGKSASPKHSVA